MAYINFKEERYKAKLQLDKRLNNNELLTKIIKNNQDIIKYKGELKYSFKYNKDLVIHNSEVDKEEDFSDIQNKNFICARFDNCKFYNIKFTNCKFIGCEFINCDFGGGGVIFEKCNMYYKESFNTPNLNIDSNLATSFVNCKLYCKFDMCDMSYLDIINSSLYKCVFKLTTLKNIIIFDSNIKNLSIEDSDLSGCKFVNTYINNLEFNDNNKTKLSEKSFFDKIQPLRKDKDEYEGIYMVYQNIANKYNDNNLKNNFGEFYFLCKNSERKTLKLTTKIRSYLYFLTCGYGERTSYALILSAIIIAIFSIIYLFAGIEIDEKVINILNYKYSGLTLLTLINESVCLSIGLFVCIGVTNGIPLSSSLIIADVEMIIGVIMVGVGIGTLTRKLVR